MIQRCAERHGASDIVSIDLLFPGPGELNADGVAERPSLRFSGPAANASLGRCLHDGLTAGLATVPVTTGSPAREAKFVVKGQRPAP